jgi:iron complex outermembrane recepter protein
MSKLLNAASSIAIIAVSNTISFSAMAQDATGSGDRASPQAGGGIAEIVVTATKRSESLQKVPISVQAMGEEALAQLGVANASDYITQMPNVTAGGGGPGQNTIYIRGLASTTPNLTTAGVAGLAPNVAMYLDEQPLSQPGRNLDVYAADLARIEVLSGPQGTLFGASSQAGVIRLITNEPKLGVFEGNVKAGVAFTKSGDMSANATAVVNVPVTSNLAVRGVVYLDHQGGYIDNVAGTRDASESARFRSADTVRYNGTVVGPVRAGFQSGADLSGVNFIQANNAGLVEKNFNDAQYSGFRATALWEITPDWSIKVAHTRQGLETDGVFFEDPTLGDLEIQRFEADKMEDNFSNTAWTVEGRLGALELVYTGAYTDRETRQRVDYSDYLFVGQYLPYYICDGSVSYPGAGGPSGTCQAPNLFVKSDSDFTSFTQELRFNTPAESRFRVTAGGFFSDQVLKERNDFHYPGSQFVQGFSPGVVGFAPNFPFMTGYTSDPGPFPAGVIFRNDVKRTDRQFGVFGEASFDIVPDVVTATFGARYYNVEVDLAGSANSSFCNLSGPNGTDTDSFGTDISDLYNGDGQYTDHASCGAPTTYTLDGVDATTPDRIVAALNAPDKAKAKGVIFKGTVSVRPTDNIMFYATYSEGFRPGLLNRPGGAQGPGGYTVPFALDTDDVRNYEIGWKTKLFENQLIFNGSAFYVDISRLQTTIFDPSITNLFFSDNAADAWIKGIEGEVTFAPYAVPGLTVSGAFSLLDTKITKVLTPTDDVQVGRDLAYAPTFQGNLRARYEWEAAPGLTAHVMPQMVHSSSKFTDIIDINRLKLDGYTTFSLAAGVAKDNWTFEIYGDNLSDERAQISGDFYYDRPRVVVNRPRTIGMRVSFQY